MQFPKQYPFAVAITLGMSIQAWSQGLSISKLRKQIFNEDFMRKQFSQVHQKQLNQAVQKGGYPDTGSGYYSRKLSYRDWYRFNVAQRIHINYIENISLAQTSVLAAALYKPKQAAFFGALYIFARSLFSHFYRQKKGALNSGRIAGVALSLFAVLMNVGIFAVNFYKSTQK